MTSNSRVNHYGRAVCTPNTCRRRGRIRIDIRPVGAAKDTRIDLDEGSPTRRTSIDN